MSGNSKSKLFGFYLLSATVIFSLLYFIFTFVDFGSIRFGRVTDVIENIFMIFVYAVPVLLFFMLVAFIWDCMSLNVRGLFLWSILLTALSFSIFNLIY